MAFAGCGANTQSETTDSTPTEQSANTDNAVASDETQNTESFDNTESTGNKVLVVYFSAIGTTKAVAEKIQSELSVDIFEIVPTEAYTSADLRYNDSGSRTSMERKDKSICPEISSSIENIADYDIIFLGYPIWWSEVPNIMYTLVESYDLSGKTIIPFRTSGGNSIGNSAKDLAKSASGANWLDGQRVSNSNVSDWLAGLSY